MFSLLETKLALRQRSGQAMKQTNLSSALRMTVSLGILALNEGFVQLNEIMDCKNTLNI